MPGVDGIEVASHLQNREMAIIFSTAYKEYAAEAFDLEAVDYLRKPYQADRLEKALGRAQAYLAQKRLTSGSMELNSNQGKRVFRFHEIAWITSAPNDRRDKTIWLKDRQEIIVKNISFEQLLALLPEQQFARINRKSIIAMDTVVSYTHEGIRCKFLDESGGPVMIPLSDQYSEDFKQKLQK